LLTLNINLKQRKIYIKALKIFLPKKG